MYMHNTHACFQSLCVYICIVSSSIESFFNKKKNRSQFQILPNEILLYETCITVTIPIFNGAGTLPSLKAYGKFKL